MKSFDWLNFVQQTFHIKQELVSGQKLSDNFFFCIFPSFSSRSAVDRRTFSVSTLLILISVRLLLKQNWDYLLKKKSQIDSLENSGPQTIKKRHKNFKVVNQIWNQTFWSCFIAIFLQKKSYYYIKHFKLKNTKNLHFAFLQWNKNVTVQFLCILYPNICKKCRKLESFFPCNSLQKLALFD